MSDLISDNPDTITKEQIDDLRAQLAFAEKQAKETNNINWKIIVQGTRTTLEKWENEYKQN